MHFTKISLIDEEKVSPVSFHFAFKNGLKFILYQKAYSDVALFKYIKAVKKLNFKF